MNEQNRAGGRPGVASQTLTIRGMTLADLPVADDILRPAFGFPDSRQGELRRYLSVQPDGWFLALADGAPAGTGGCVDFGEFAWIGLMGVHPSFQSRGVGRFVMRHLLSFLQGKNVPMILLDASPAGKPLYESLGFQTEAFATLWEGPDPGGSDPTRTMREVSPCSPGWRRETNVARGARNPTSTAVSGVLLSTVSPTSSESAAAPVTPETTAASGSPIMQAPSGSSGLAAAANKNFLVQVVDVGDFSELLTFDRTLFGGDRSRVLEAFWRDFPGRMLVARDNTGAVTGFTLAQGRRLGPWMATDTAAAEALLRAGLALPREGAAQVILPEENEAGKELFQRYGFVPKRTNTHMRLGGTNLVTRRENVYGQASFGIG